MGVFSRFSDIVNANINSALDSAEDPQKIVRLIITEMEETLVEIRSSTAGYLADKKQLDRQLSQLNKQAQQWSDKAELALSKDREDLARAALVEKQSIDEQIVQANADVEKLDKILAALQQDSARLNEKMAEAKAKQKSLEVRKSSVVTRLKVRQQTHSCEIDNAIEKFERYERKIDDLESQVEAYDVTNVTLLSEQFRQMENDSKIDDAMVALKKKVANG